MNRGAWQQLVSNLRGAEYHHGQDAAGYRMVHQVEFAAGLTDAEVVAVEQRFGFLFPPTCENSFKPPCPQPSVPQLAQWRRSTLREWLDRPRQGVLFDVEHNGFWLEEWGPPPASIAAHLRVADELVTAAPQLIPDLQSSDDPAEPHLPGNPVFSVHQTDIIVYGVDLTDYLRTEFDLPRRGGARAGNRPIRFWDIDRFQVVRSGPDGSCTFDNRRASFLSNEHSAE